YTPSAPATNGVPVLVARTAASVADVEKIVGASQLVSAIREYGHLAARVDPLGSDPPGSLDLQADQHGLSESDLDNLPPSVVSGPLAEGASSAGEAIAKLRELYCSSIGFDFDHVHQIAERHWLIDAVETERFAVPMERSARRALLRRLTDVE